MGLFVFLQKSAAQVHKQSAGYFRGQFAYALAGEPGWQQTATETLGLT